MASFRNVSVIIPVINETYLFQQTVDIIEQTCAHRDLAEIIAVVCDHSTPESVMAVQEAKKTFAACAFVIYRQNQPFIGAAYQEAFAIAKGSHIIIMSADLETNPYQVKDFIEKEKLYPDAVVIASRWRKGGGFSGYQPVKLVCNFIFNNMLRVLYVSRLSDMTYGYKSLPSALANAIDWKERRHPFFLELALKPLRLGVEMKEIPSRWVARTEGVSQNSFFQNFKYFKVAFGCRWIAREKILKSGSPLYR